MILRPPNERCPAKEIRAPGSGPHLSRALKTAVLIQTAYRDGVPVGALLVKKALNIQKSSCLVYQQSQNEFLSEFESSMFRSPTKPHRHTDVDRCAHDVFATDFVRKGG